MTTEKRAVLTPEAEKELHKALENYRTKLLEDAREGRFIPGEDVVEITGSDIRKAAAGFSSDLKRRRQEGKLVLTRLVSNLYIVGGAIAFMAGIFWRAIVDLLNFSAIEVQIALSGLGIMIVGIIARYYVSYRETERWRYLLDREIYTLRPVQDDDSTSSKD